MAARQPSSNFPPEQAHVRRQVHERVHVTVGPVLATSDAADDPQVGYVMGGGGRNQIPPSSPDLPPAPVRSSSLR
jgi:hypothetical protein